MTDFPLLMKFPQTLQNYNYKSYMCMREICFPVKETERCSWRKFYCCISTLPNVPEQKSVAAFPEGGTPCFQDNWFVQVFPDSPVRA